MIKNLFGYWEVWHLALSMPAFMIAMKFWDKQRSIMAVMALAILWEIGEWIYETIVDYKDYGGSIEAFKLNAIKDLLAALVGSLVCIVLL